MFTLLRTVLTVGGSTFSLVKVLAVAIPALVASHGLTWFVTSLVYENVGRLKERADVQAAVARAATEHAEWLNDVAGQLEKDFDAFQARARANDKIVKGISDETSRLPDGGADVFSASFLRFLDGIR